MKNRVHVISDVRTRWLPGLALVITLYLMYVPVFLTDYLMNDEWYRIGSSESLAESAKVNFLFSGRSLYGINSSLVDRFVQYDPFRLQVVRFVNFASIVTIALVLFLFLEKRSRNTWFSFLIVLFLFSQRSFQGAMAYSLLSISNAQPAMWLSLLAFYVHFYSDHVRFPKSLRLVTAGLLLILAMQCTQALAFFSMVPLAYLGLSDWKNQRRKVFEFLLLASAVFLLSAFAYQAGLHYWHGHGRQGYVLGEQNLEAVTKHPGKVLVQAINPLTYWDAFEMWSYPFPFHYIRPWGMKRIPAALIMIVWGALILWTVIAELRNSPAERRQVSLKWLAALVCLGFGAVFIITDAPLRIEEHRPHMTLTFAAVAIFSAAYCLQILASKHPSLNNRVLKAMATILVVTIAFGAQAGVLRNYVNNRMEELDFIRTELMSRDALELRNVIVVLPEWSECVTEPCGPWVGHVTEDQWHLALPEAYRYAMSTVGISPEGKNITFVGERPKEIPTDSIIIDWKKYASARKAYLNYWRQIGPF